MISSHHHNFYASCFDTEDSFLDAFLDRIFECNSSQKSHFSKGFIILYSFEILNDFKALDRGNFAIDYFFSKSDIPFSFFPKKLQIFLEELLGERANFLDFLPNLDSMAHIPYDIWIPLHIYHIFVSLPHNAIRIFFKDVESIKIVSHPIVFDLKFFSGIFYFFELLKIFDESTFSRISDGWKLINWYFTNFGLPIFTELSLKFIFLCNVNISSAVYFGYFIRRGCSIKISDRTQYSTSLDIIKCLVSEVFMFQQIGCFKNLLIKCHLRDTHRALSNCACFIDDQTTS